MTRWDRWLDASVIASFDRRGFTRHARAFPNDAERDLRGMSVLVTGGTKGIGQAAAFALADRGAMVFAWARDARAGQQTVAHITRAGGQAFFTSVDMGNLEAVATAARAWQGPPLAGVILNAGAMPLQRRLTDDGHELIWASQVLGHLTLLRVLHAGGRLGPHSRVLWVSSGGMYLQRLDLRDLRCDRGYQRHTVYANAKRAQVILSETLAEHWSDIPCGSMHPGWVDTGAVRLSMPFFHRLTSTILRDARQGADTIVWFVARDSIPPTGRFWFDRAEAPAHRSRRTRTRSGDRQRLFDRVWTATEPFVREP